MGLYRRDAILSTRRTLVRLPMVVGLAVLAAHVVQMLGLWLGWRVTPVDVADLSVAAMLGFAASAALARAGLFLLLRGGVFRRRIIVIGAGRRVAELMAMVSQHGSDPHFDVVFVHEPALGPRDPDLGRGGQQTVVVANDSNYRQLALAHGVDLIVVAPGERRGMRLERLLDCKKNGFPVVQHLEFVEHEARRVDLTYMELGWLL